MHIRVSGRLLESLAPLLPIGASADTGEGAANARPLERSMRLVECADALVAAYVGEREAQEPDCQPEQLE